MTRLFRFLIRISSFLSKELTVIFRQPMLLLTLVLGPFLIMFLFGLAYPNQNRILRTTFVVKDPNAFQTEIETFTKNLNSNILDYTIESDKEKALAKLALNQTDLVIIVPEAPSATIQSNQQAEFLIYHNEIDPFQIGYIQSVARIYVDEVNRQIIQAETEQAQVSSGALQSILKTAIEKIQTLRKAIPPGEANATAQAEDLEKTLTDLDDKLTLFRSLAAGVLVSPFMAKVAGLFGGTLTVTAFFAPAVIVLLLQHVSITFASLSIVRETRSGIMELFRVAPITAFETLLGKYLSYLFFEIILAGVITVLAVWLLKDSYFRLLAGLCHCGGCPALYFPGGGVPHLFDLGNRHPGGSIFDDLTSGEHFLQRIFPGPAADEVSDHNPGLVITGDIRNPNAARYHVTRISRRHCWYCWGLQPSVWGCS